MDIRLLKSTFANNVGKPTSLKPVASPHTKQPATITAGNVPPTNTGKTVTTDNSQPIAQKQSIIEPLKNFSQAIGKKVMTKTFLKVQDNKKIKKQDQNSETFSEMMHRDNSLTVQELLIRPVVFDKTAGAKDINKLQQQVESQIPGKTVRLIADSPPPSSTKAPSLVTQFAKTITSEPDQIVSTATKPANKPIQLTIDQSQIKSEIISPAAPESPLITNTQPERSEDAGKMQISDKAFVAKEKLVNQENAKELLREAPPKTLLSNNKITADSEQAVVTNKPFPFVPDSPKTQLSNATFAAPLDQKSHSQQKVLIGQESPASAAEETTPNKADTDQKDHRGKTELFELPEKNRVQVRNPSVKSIAQKMNPQRTQLSAPQVENGSNLLSNQTSNPDMELGEQVFVGGNVQPGITEQSSASPASTAFAKIASSADSGAGVGSQIQESIHSSLRSGSQQIVIRLNPPELGKVAIKFSEQGNDITGLLQVDKPQTRDQIQQALPEIIQNLQDSGIHIKRLEVVLTNQQEQHTSKDQSSTPGQDGFSGQQSSPNPESQGNNTTYNQWLRNIDNITEFTESQMQLTDNSINMLL